MNKITIGIAVVVAVGVLGFYGGTKYESGKAGDRFAEAGRRFGQGSDMPATGQRSGSVVGGFVTGDVIAKDETSITLKLVDGGSRIVLVSGSTAIEKTASGSLDDLAIGKSVIVRGSENEGGSMTAQSIQLQRFMMRPQRSPSPSPSTK